MILASCVLWIRLLASLVQYIYRQPGIDIPFDTTQAAFTSTYGLARASFSHPGRLLNTMKRTFNTDNESKTHPERERIPIISSLNAPVSPPRRRSRPEQRLPVTPASSGRDNINAQETSLDSKPDSPPNLAAIEAGQIEVSDHLGIFSSRLSQCIRPLPSSEVPRLQIADWANLYRRNERPHGRHFVIHQHDHPIAGPHYDLRLQFSETSSVSWSVMYGLPGDPNSRRLNRNATETRVHSFWNHLIETASPNTGSMIIWDTGEYEILPYQMESQMPETDDSQSSESSCPAGEDRSESEKLWEAFNNRKIRLRLHGTRLPPDYTIILRLDKTTQPPDPARMPRKRRRRNQPLAQSQAPATSSNSSPSPEMQSPQTPTEDQETPEANPTADSDDDKADLQIRIKNAYPGSTNSIGSIHQRRWFITLDRLSSGFIDEPGSGPGKKRWVRKRDSETGEIMGFEPFYVRGPDAERSVVTVRLGRDVLDDEKVQGFTSRRGWRPVLQ